MKDFGLNKGLDNLAKLRQTLTAVTDRFAGLEAQGLNVHVEFPLFQRLALPVTTGKTKIAGIKIHHTRMLRLMEILFASLHPNPGLAHGLVERDGKRYCYRLADKGAKVAWMLVLFHKRVCGPVARSLFERRPNEQYKPKSKIETAYYKADVAIQNVLNELAMAA